MDLSKTKVRVAFAIALASIAAVIAFRSLRSGPPPCDCYYPNAGKYGVMSGGGCTVKECKESGPVHNKGRIEVITKQ
jgi:hypothetical protein